MVSSSVEPLTKVAYPVPSSVKPSLHIKSEPKVVAMITSSIDPTPPLKSAKVVSLVPSLVDPTLHLESETQVVYLIPSLVNPIHPLESKPDTAHVFLVDTESTVLGGIPPSPTEPPPSNEAILSIGVF
jgi:hypothetical protein